MPENRPSADRVRAVCAAVENADSHLNNVSVTTYSQMRDALRGLEHVLEREATPDVMTPAMRQYLLDQIRPLLRVAS